MLRVDGCRLLLFVVCPRLLCGTRCLLMLLAVLFAVCRCVLPADVYVCCCCCVLLLLFAAVSWLLSFVVCCVCVLFVVCSLLFVGDVRYVSLCVVCYVMCVVCCLLCVVFRVVFVVCQRCLLMRCLSCVAVCCMLCVVGGDC